LLSCQTFTAAPAVLFIGSMSFMSINRMRHKRHYRKAFAAKPYTPTKHVPPKKTDVLKALYGTPSPSRFHAYHHVREKFRKLLLVLRPNVEDADEQHHDHDKHSVLIRKDGIDFSILGVLAVWKFFHRHHEILKQRCCSYSGQHCTVEDTLGDNQENLSAFNQSIAATYIYFCYCHHPLL
jgi:hypothetical protein